MWLKLLFFISFSHSFIQATSTDDNTKESNFKKGYSYDKTIWGERENEMFGNNIAIWSDLLVIGALGDQSTGINCGASYIYGKIEAHHEGEEEWELVATLHPEDGKYGIAVALDYHTIVIGAHKHDQNGQDSGAAYLYNRASKIDKHSNIEKIMKLTAYDGSGQDYFGSAVAVNQNVTVIGAWGCDKVGTLGGCVYIWTKYYGNNQHGEWVYTQQVTANDGDGYERFGTSVAAYSGYIAIGAPGAIDKYGHEVGAVYIFIYTYDDSHYLGKSWKQSARIFPSDGLHYDQFGQSLSLWDKTLIVGSPHHSDLESDSPEPVPETGAVYTFSFTSSKKWELVSKILPENMIEYGHFGSSLDIYDDMMVIGAYNNLGKGSASIYRKVYDENNIFVSWKFHTSRQPENEIPGDLYGSTVSIYNAYIAVGANGASLAWEDPHVPPEKQVYQSGGVYIYFGQYEPPAEEIKVEKKVESPVLQIVGLTFGSVVLIGIGVTAFVFIFLEFNGKLEKFEGTEYQLTDLESSHRSLVQMKDYALSYFKSTPHEQSKSTSDGPVTLNPLSLSPFLDPPSSQSRNRVIDSMDSSSNSMASISSHSVETTNQYGPSQKALDESIRLGISRNNLDSTQ